MILNDVAKTPHHQAIQELSEHLALRTSNNDLDYFRIIVAHRLSVVAASMRATVTVGDRRQIPLGVYAMAFGPSGSGKSYSVHILESEIFNDWQRTFTDYTMPDQQEKNLRKLSMQMAARNGTSDQEEYENLQTGCRAAGPFPEVFQDITSAALAQVRYRAQAAGVGSINLQVDEFGMVLSDQNMVKTLGDFLHLWDTGEMGRKVLKNTAETKRMPDLKGATPATMLAFGTPDKVFDGSSNENTLMSLLDAGHARRMIYADGRPQSLRENQTAEELYYSRLTTTKDPQMEAYRNHFANLADHAFVGWDITGSDQVGIAAAAYEIECEKRMREIREQDTIQRTEMRERTSKAVKLAGVLAFVEGSMILTMDHLLAAIKLVEESGKALKRILKREEPHQRLARYLATVGREVTHADLADDLPFLKGASAAKRTDMLALATAHGITRHLVIKRHYGPSNIEFISGEALEETNTDSVTLSHSCNYAYGYTPERVPFSDLYGLLTQEDYNWANHHFEEEHRESSKAIPGFDLLTLDVDGGVPLSVVHDLLQDYEFITATTKRHTEEEPRFRLILPMTCRLKLDANDYTAFMGNVMDWLPFEVDRSAVDRSRKWETNPKAIYHHNVNADTKLFDCLRFIPRSTSRSDFMERQSKLGSLDAFERWFATQMSEGNRNNHMIRFALALVDQGCDYPEVERRVLDFNKRLKADPLEEQELRNSVLKTVAKRISKIEAGEV